MAAEKNRILLVDDDRSLLRLLSMRLSAVGYSVTAVESGEQALLQLPLYNPHLIITDLQMAGMDGMTLFNQVHARDPLLPVLILTAHGTIPGAVEAIRSGVFSYLTKPYDSKILLEHVARAMKLPEQCPSTAPVLQLRQS
jgi:two-component system response regulator GlrR